MFIYQKRLAHCIPANLLLCNMILVLFCGMLYFPKVYAQEKCTVLLKKAEEEYLSGKFNNTIELLNNCLQHKELAKPEQIRTYRLMALAYLKIEKPREAEITVQRILKLDCRYQPYPTEEEQEFIRLVNEVSADLKCKDCNKKWLLIGGGALAAAGIITAVILHNKKDNTHQFPPAPKQP
jgi:hypothetical protein